MVGDITSSVRISFCMDYYIPFIYCSQKTVVHVQVNIFQKIHTACRNDANGIEPDSNSKMTDSG